ncbi:MAG: pyrroline-5-carboxylate reductase [Prochloraceae cyanobacterium]
MSIKLSAIGGGVMGEAILSRLLDRKLYSASEILVSDPEARRRDYLKEKYQIQVSANNQDAISAAEVLLLAIKPQVLNTVVASLGDLSEISHQPLIISILAGVPLTKLEAAFANYPVIRAMPNTPATVGAAVSAIAPGKNVEQMHISTALSIFEAIGEVVEVPESLMDAVTGLAGSGPAYVALAIEALADGGVAAGLPRAVATKLALQTVLGTAKLIESSGLHPAELKDRVTSPGGTTIAGIVALERAGFRSALIEAVKAAYQRSRELGS